MYTEIARYTFYIPPILFDGLTPFRCRAIGCPDVFLTPIPATPINHVPVISKITRTAIVAGSAQAKRFGPGSHEHALITLYGDNLGSEWTVWL